MPDANGVIHPVALSVPADKWERIFGEQEQKPEVKFWASAGGWGIEPMPGLLKSVWTYGSDDE